ncbi:hypothetical protein ACS0TY_016166 [Phlomoides rotata]
MLSRLLYKLANPRFSFTAASLQQSPCRVSEGGAFVHQSFSSSNEGEVEEEAYEEVEEEAPKDETEIQVVSIVAYLGFQLSVLFPVS